MLETRWGPGPWPADGAASFVLRPWRERARRARGLHLARAPTQPARGYCSRRGLAALWPSPRARCRPGFLTLGRRRTPAPIRAPAAPSTLSALAPFKPSSQVPRRAHSETRVPYRESTAPSPSRRRPHPSARGRGQNERLVSPHETKKAPPLPPSEGKPSARARLSRPPTPPAPPLRAHSSPPLPPPQTASPASVAGPASCACPPTLPLLARVRARPGWVGEGGWGQRDLARPTHLPTLCGTVLRLRAGVFVLRTPRVSTPPGMRRVGGTAAVVEVEVAGGGWGMGWQRGLRRRGGRGTLKLVSEAPRSCVKAGGGQAGLGTSRADPWAKGGLRNRFHP